MYFPVVGEVIDLDQCVRDPLRIYCFRSAPLGQGFDGHGDFPAERLNTATLGLNHRNHATHPGIF